MDKQKIAALRMRKILKAKIDYFNKHNDLGQTISFYSTMAFMRDVNDINELKAKINAVEYRIRKAELKI